MTPETFVVVVLLLVVKYTLEFADRRRWRQKRRRRRVSRTPATRQALTPPAAEPAIDTSPAEDATPTGDPFWDMVTARIAELPHQEAGHSGD